MLCPAYNEEEKIEEKIKSFLNLDYPKDKIEMIVISDDSTDRTNEVVKKYTKDNNIRLVIQKPRKGKQCGHNLVEPTIKSDYVLSTDANSIFSKGAITELVKTMLSDKKVGMAVGQLKLVSNGKDSGEGLYWAFETYLKKVESRLYSIICANGSIFLIKREFFTKIHPASVDDFERTLIVLENKNKAKYVTSAIVTEDVTEKPTEEIKRKIRIISGEWSALFRHLSLLNPFRDTKIFFQLISHKVIRWLLPFLSISILVSNYFIISNVVFLVIFILQIIVYLGGIFELILERKGKAVKILKLPAYFVAMNYASFIAFIIFLLGRQNSMWDTNR